MKKQEKPENPNAFKHMINKNVLERMASAITSVYPSFDRREFLKTEKLFAPLELKQRVHLVRDQLRKMLPQEYPQALEILLKSLKADKLSGFALWPYTEFIQTFGLDHTKSSLLALREITQLFTGEFAVRPFIKRKPDECFRFLLDCASSSNVYIRRWSSEGTRSRLPWGERLDLVIKDPKLTLPILEKLKHDDELYVRKSVANHLNDISKDNPQVVLTILKKWQKQAGVKNEKKIDWIIRMALRTLIKNGDPQALELIGASQEIDLKTGPLKINKKIFRVNDRLEFGFEIQSQSKKPQKIVVDYIIHYVQANKKNSPKVYKLKTFELMPQQKLTIQKSHHLKKITTRRYYPGPHRLEIQINGKIFGNLPWILNG